MPPGTPSPADHRFVRHLRREFGAEAVLTGVDAEPYLTSWRGVFRSDALAVIRPASVTQTAAMVRACAAAHIAIVAQGGNTGLCGGAVPAGPALAPGALRA